MDDLIKTIELTYDPTARVLKETTPNTGEIGSTIDNESINFIVRMTVDAKDINDRFDVWLDFAVKCEVDHRVIRPIGVLKYDKDNDYFTYSVKQYVLAAASRMRKLPLQLTMREKDKISPQIVVSRNTLEFKVTRAIDSLGMAVESVPYVMLRSNPWEWDEEIVYQKGAIVVYKSHLYESSHDLNEGNEPSEDSGLSVHWSKVSNSPFHIERSFVLEDDTTEAYEKLKAEMLDALKSYSDHSFVMIEGDTEIEVVARLYEKEIKSGSYGDKDIYDDENESYWKFIVDMSGKLGPRGYHYIPELADDGKTLKFSSDDPDYVPEEVVVRGAFYRPIWIDDGRTLAFEKVSGAEEPSEELIEGVNLQGNGMEPKVIDNYLYIYEVVNGTPDHDNPLYKEDISPYSLKAEVSGDMKYLTLKAVRRGVETPVATNVLIRGSFLQPVLDDEHKTFSYEVVSGAKDPTIPTPMNIQGQGVSAEFDGDYLVLHPVNEGEVDTTTVMAKHYVKGDSVKADITSKLGKIRIGTVGESGTTTWGDYEWIQGPVYKPSCDGINLSFTKVSSEDQPDEIDPVNIKGHSIDAKFEGTTLVISEKDGNGAVIAELDRKDLKGDTGPAGPGVAEGGTDGQFLMRSSGSESTKWVDGYTGVSPISVSADREISVDLSAYQQKLTAGTGISIDGTVVTNTARPDVDKEYVDTEIGKKQDTLVSGTSIKTINGTSLLGEGDFQIQTTLSAGTGIKIEDDKIINTAIPDVDKAYVDDGLSKKQDTLTAGNGISIANNTVTNTSIPDISKSYADATFATKSQLTAKQDKNTVLTDVTVASTAWTDSTDGTYVKKTSISVSGVTANDYANVVFSLSDATSGKLSPVCETGAGTVTIYAKESIELTIPTIVIMKE